MSLLGDVYGKGAHVFYIGEESTCLYFQLEQPRPV